MHYTSDIPALHYPRWVFITLKTDTDFISDYVKRLYPFINQAIETKNIESYIITREGNQVVLLFFKTTAFQNTTYLKPELERLYGNQIADYKDFYLLSYAIPDTHGIAEKLLAASSISLSQYMIENQEDRDTALPFFLPMHIIFAYAMGMTTIEIAEFYNHVFNNSIQAAFSDQPENAQALIIELSSLFDTQKESLIPFVEYVYTALSEDSLDEHREWYLACKQAHELILAMQREKKFVLPDDFKANLDLTASPALQERWILLEQYLYFIDAQLADTFTMQYIIKESISSTNQ